MAAEWDAEAQARKACDKVPAELMAQYFHPHKLPVAYSPFGFSGLSEDEMKSAKYADFRAAVKKEYAARRVVLETRAAGPLRTRAQQLQAEETLSPPARRAAARLLAAAAE